MTAAEPTNRTTSEGHHRATSNRRYEWRHARASAYAQRSDVVLLALALLMIPLLVIPEAVELSRGWRRALLAADIAIWAVFAGDYLLRLAWSTPRRAYVRQEWPNLLLVALPMLRPLRAARLLRVARAGAALSEFGQEARRILAKRHLDVVLLAAALLVVGCAFAIAVIEEGHGGPITGMGDGLWWAVTTLTTVGYGDAFPVTAAGRLLAVLLMVAGISLFGIVTASIAARFVEQDTEVPGSVEAKLDEVLRRLERLETKRDGSPDGGL